MGRKTVEVVSTPRKEPYVVIKGYGRWSYSVEIQDPARTYSSYTGWYGIFLGAKRADRIAKRWLRKYNKRKAHQQLRTEIH